MRLLIALLTSVFLTGCAVVPDFQETCVGSDNLRASTFGYRHFYVEALLPVDFRPTRSEIVLHSPAVDTSVRALKFDLASKEIGLSQLLNRSRCRDFLLHTYSVYYDEAQWDEFWNGAPSESFEFEYRFSERPQSASAVSFGLAFVDSETGEPILSCGCYNL